jgi:hypothetical protein
MTFTNIVVYDPRTNTNVQVNANIREKNAIAVTAAASAPLEFNTNDGQIIRLKDYDYKVVQAAYGNTQLVIQVRQDNIHLDRSTPLYAASSTVSLTNLGDATQRARADKLSLQSILPLISATASVQLNNYDEKALRSSYDPNKMQLQYNAPQASAVTNVNLVSKGYNEQQMRDAKVKDLVKTSNFGEYEDRVTRANPLLRGGVMVN